MWLAAVLLTEPKCIQPSPSHAFHEESENGCLLIAQQPKKPTPESADQKASHGGARHSHLMMFPRKLNVRLWATAARLLFRSVAAGRLSGSPAATQAAERRDLMVSCRCPFPEEAASAAGLRSFRPRG